MKKKFIKIFIAILICFFLFKIKNAGDKESTNLRSNKKSEETIISEDTAIVKETLLKLFEPQIKELNFIQRRFAYKMLNTVSKQLAIYYNELINFQNDPQKAIKIANEIISNYQAYVEFIALNLIEMEDNLNKEYLSIKNRYCTGFWEKLFNTQEWKVKATREEINKINDLEFQLEEVRNILLIFNRTRTLFKIVDWTIYSSSPFSWLVRNHIGL